MILVHCLIIYLHYLLDLAFKIAILLAKGIIQIHKFLVYFD